MKKYLSLLFIAMMALVSCSEADDFKAATEAKDTRDARDNLESLENFETLEITGSFVSMTHNPTDLIEFFPGGSFYYLADCNNQTRVNDFTTWRIGRYAGTVEAMTLTYEDGGTATATASEDSIVYLEGNIRKVFVPSAGVSFTVTKNPNFNGSHDKDKD